MGQHPLWQFPADPDLSPGGLTGVIWGCGPPARIPTRAQEAFRGQVSEMPGAGRASFREQAPRGRALVQVSLCASSFSLGGQLRGVLLEVDRGSEAWLRSGRSGLGLELSGLRLLTWRCGYHNSC